MESKKNGDLEEYSEDIDFSSTLNKFAKVIPNILNFLVENSLSPLNTSYGQKVKPLG